MNVRVRFLACFDRDLGPISRRYKLQFTIVQVRVPVLTSTSEFVFHESWEEKYFCCAQDDNVRC